MYRSEWVEGRRQRKEKARNKCCGCKEELKEVSKMLSKQKVTEARRKGWKIGGDWWRRKIRRSYWEKEGKYEGDTG